MPAFEIIHSARNGSATTGTIRVARTGKEYGFSVSADAGVVLSLRMRTVPSHHLRDVRHFVRTQFPAVAEVSAPAAYPVNDGGAEARASALAACFVREGEIERRNHLESEGFEFSYIAGAWFHSSPDRADSGEFAELSACMDDAEAQPALDGRRADGKTWADALAWRVAMRRPDGSRFDRAQRAITAEDARYLAALAEPGATVLDVYAAEDAPDDALGAQLAAGPALAHADEWRTRRSTWIPLSVALAAALVSFLPGGASAAGFDPGFARAGAGPASNALALALWCLFLACAAGCVLAFADRPRRARREQDAETLRVRCRRIAEH